MEASRLARAAVALALLVASTVLFASGQPPAGAAAGGADRLKKVGFHATGYPIVDTPISIQAWTSKGVLNTVPYDSMTLVADLQKKTNVDLVFTEIPEDQYSEKVNLMFASRGYPQVLFTSAANDLNVWNAAQGGDMWPLNDLIKNFAPNWQKAFEERPIIARALTRPDGKIYSLPYYRELLSDYGVRDVVAINVDWMKKVGKTMPATTDELYDVLKAFRKGIDSGVLPKNGVPWLVRYHQWANGGEWEIYNAFGLWMKGQGSGAEMYLSVNNGKVEFGATDPRLKEAAKYLHKLFAENLITPEMFTITSSQYGAANRTKPPFVGMYTAYFLYESLDDVMDPLPPPKGPAGVQRFRSQPVRLEMNRFMMFKPLELPEAMIRFIDHWADDDFALGASYGGPTIKTNPDGTKTVVGADEEWRRHGPHNAWPTYMSKRVDEKTRFLGDQGLRDKIIREVYLPHIWPQERHYTYITYTDKETEELAVLNTEIGNFVKSSIAKWIRDGNVDATWDAYIAQLDRLGLKRAMEIFQTAYDRFHGKK